MAPSPSLPWIWKSPIIRLLPRIREAERSVKSEAEPDDIVLAEASQLSSTIRVAPRSSHKPSHKDGPLSSGIKVSRTIFVSLAAFDGDMVFAAGPRGFPTVP